MENNIDKDEEKKLLIKKVINQTNLSYIDAENLLDENNYDFIKVIRAYYGLDKNKKKNEEKSEFVNVNQQIFKEIRNYMDNASKNYEINKKY